MTQFEFEQQLMIAYVRSGQPFGGARIGMFADVAEQMEKRRPVPQPTNQSYWGQQQRNNPSGFGGGQS